MPANGRTTRGNSALTTARATFKIALTRPKGRRLCRPQRVMATQTGKGALLRRKIRLAGPLKLLVAFGKCFPQ
jgi:hypothetical protein